MSDTTYDLFKGSSQEGAIWIEAVEGLEAATERMNRLAATASSDYFLFQSGNVIASVKNAKAPSRTNQQTRNIIILSSNQNRSANLSEILKKQEVDPISAITVKQYRDILSKQALDLVFCDPKLPDGDYKDVINAARLAGSLARIVVTSRFASWPEFLEAMRAGAFDVISAPCRYKDVEWVMMQEARDDRKRARQLMTANEGVQVRRATA
jgi:ActR/RegA family two-component response regulator